MYTFFSFSDSSVGKEKWKWKSLTLWTVALQAPTVHGILQAKVLEWVAIPFSGGSSWPRDQTSVGKESTCNSGDPGSIPGSGGSPGEGLGYPLQYSWASLVAQMVKNLLQCGRSEFDPWVGKIPWRRRWQPTLEFLPGESPWTEKPGRLQSMGLRSVRHDWVTKHKRSRGYGLQRMPLL